MILSIDVVDLSWVPEPLSQVCLCIGYVVLVAKKLMVVYKWRNFA
jgi:hypothetical protein